MGDPQSDDPRDDTDSFDLATQVAPSFPGVFRTTGVWFDGPSAMPPGDAPTEGDFEVLSELGRGASGVVYLARELSLARVVALKVTHNVGSEARTMATLEHRHIVQVFSETVSRDRRLRLICMQYVPGITLAELIGRLRARVAQQPPAAPTFPDVVASKSPPPVHDGGRAPHGLLTHPQLVQEACQLAAQIAEALQHAHRQGVLHRDIKPANILIDYEAQPSLADFSLSLHTAAEPGDEVFGGTLAYMAPEHLDAFDRRHPQRRDAVDERSDIYSLGRVLYELLTLEPPSAPSSKDCTPEQFAGELAEQRRRHVPAVEHQAGEISPALNWTLARCLAADPAERFEDAGQLAAALRGCAHLSAAVDRLPAGGFTRWLRSAPLLAPCLLCSGANLVAVAVGTAYTFSTPRVTWPGSSAWWLIAWTAAHVVAATSIVVSCAVPRIRMILPVLRGAADVSFHPARARQQAVRIPTFITAVTLAVWLPNYIVFPLFISWVAPHASVFLDFLAVYSVIMLIAVSCTYFFSEYVALRAYYPYVWTDTRQIRTVAAAELAGVPRRIRPFQLLAAAVPVSAAAAVVLLGPEHFAERGYFTFRVLAIVLIVGGFLGLLATGSVRSTVELIARRFTGKAE